MALYTGSVCSVSDTPNYFLLSIENCSMQPVQNQLHGKVVHTADMSEDRKIICEFSPSISISCVL